jgi:hypothetical protein
MTYALLIYRLMPPSVPLPEGTDQAALAQHRALQQETAGRGDLHAVARLDVSGTARTVRSRGGAHEVTDGPFIETKEWLVGFYVVDCRDEAEALAHARRICLDDQHAVEVRPVTWRWKP